MLVESELHMGEFPSGQRGQTVNLLAVLSVVQIHLPPPSETPSDFGWCFCFGMGIREVDLKGGS